MMKAYIKRLTAFILFATMGITLYAGNITGRIVDSNKEPMVQASIRLLAAKDSAYIAGDATNSKGGFKFQGIKSGKYIKNMEV